MSLDDENDHFSDTNSRNIQRSEINSFEGGFTACGTTAATHGLP